jgi:hypothetical protein
MEPAMTDEVTRICRRWVVLSALGALAGFLITLGLASPKPGGVLGILALATPFVTVAIAQAVALYRQEPASDLALLWILLTPLFALAAYVIGFVGFSGWRAPPSVGAYAWQLIVTTTPVFLVLGWIQGAILKAWLGRAPLWALITAVGNVLALLAVIGLWRASDALGLAEALGFDRSQVMAAGAAPLAFGLALFQLVSLKNLALHSESFIRALRR